MLAHVNLKKAFVAILFLIVVYVIVQYLFLDKSFQQITSPLTPQTKYEQCIESCVEGWEKNIIAKAEETPYKSTLMTSCDNTLGDVMSNYDEYYTEAMLKQGQEDYDTYVLSLSTKEQQRLFCFGLVLNCRTSLCKDYL